MCEGRKGFFLPGPAIIEASPGVRQHLICCEAIRHARKNGGCRYTSEIWLALRIASFVKITFPGVSIDKLTYHSSI